MKQTVKIFVLLFAFVYISISQDGIDPIPVQVNPDIPTNNGVGDVAGSDATPQVVVTAEDAGQMRTEQNIPKE